MVIMAPGQTQQTHITRVKSSHLLEAQIQVVTPLARISKPLPPTDTGKQAYLFLLGAFFTEAFVWGFPFGYGVFQSYYETHKPFAGDHNIATINTTATGLMYLSLPIWFILAAKLPSLRRWTQIIGLIVMCTGLLGSSFATTVPQLIATQGVLYGLGGAATYSTMILYLDEWFVKRKGLAFGIVWAGQGFAGAVVPPLMTAVLNHFGNVIALRVWALVNFVILAPLLLAIKPRLPQQKDEHISFRFALTPSFVILEAGNVIQSLGFFIPPIYLPTYAASVGASPFAASATLIAFNIASIIGCIGIGALVDRTHVTTSNVVCSVGGAISVLLIWGMSTKLSLLIVFAILYGLGAGSASAAWPGIMKLVKKKVPDSNPTIIFSFLALGRGIGNIISGPISEELISNGKQPQDADLGYQTRYMPMIIFCGVTAAVAGLTVLGRMKKGLL